MEGRWYFLVRRRGLCWLLFYFGVTISQNGAQLRMQHEEDSAFWKLLIGYLGGCASSAEMMDMSQWPNLRLKRTCLSLEDCLFRNGPLASKLFGIPSGWHFCEGCG